jgi:hypothetical protein
VGLQNTDQPRKIFRGFLELPYGYSALEPFSAGQIGVPIGAKHVLAGFGTAPGFAVKKTVSPASAV